MDLENTPPKSVIEQSTPTLKSFQFFGKTSEYFGIWLVNLLLTMVTLGIYSPWAKVRRVNYMLGNVDLNGYRFKYLAKPINILKGRVIAIVVMGLFGTAFHFIQQSTMDLGLFVHIPIMIASYLIFYVFLAVLVWKGLQFSFRMISYRNVQFSFHGTYKETLIGFFVLPILAFFTLGAFGPLSLRYFANFMTNNVRYGELEFNANVSTEECIKPFFGIMASWTIFIILPMASMVYLSLNMENPPSPATTFSVLALYIIFLMGVFITNGISSALTRNLMINHLALGNNSSFKSTISIPKFAFIVLTNALAILFSLGFAAPWAQIRKQRYLCENGYAALSEEVDSVISKENSAPSAIGVEGAELMDVGIGL